MVDRYSDNEPSKRDIPSFIEPRPPLIQNPFMRPRPQKATNLLELFEEDSEIEEPELVQVYLRLKPCNVPSNLYEVRSEKCLVTSMDTTTAGHGRRTQHNVSKMYTFSKIFGPESTQKEIFEQVVKNNLKKLVDGHSFTLLTYGASGSGKTYTLMGTVGAPGLVPRSLEYVFRLIDAAQLPSYKPMEGGADKLSYAQQDYELQWVKKLRHISAPLREKYRRMSAQLHSDLTASTTDLTNRIRHYVWVSFVEIYNEAIYDLLAPPDKRTKLRIREDNSGNTYVKGVTQAFVRSGEEAYDVMAAGRHNLVVAATGVHAHSSRSHCIFTITMLTEEEDGSLRLSAVRLCDLAGCERARATGNTGARLQESRAINSSLHVLERCLHTLRRKQRLAAHASLVPYRESKLTRLLGSGLSGSRGEAVSMVVTLNPSPQYAQETKHVLTLAAVAQDIQVNNTLFTSALESSSQDTTVECSAELMKLRADNERLHFELAQAQSRNKELMASLEERQQEAAATMRELVEEAKDLTRQYYEPQIRALREEMDELVEEYEARLSSAPPAAPALPAQPSGSGTPARYLQTKVAQLMADIAVLEEKLTEERLARARAEKEVEHLHSCIEERDEKLFKDAASGKQEDVMSLSDSDHDSDDEPNDPLNESLEPVLKKEALNRSQAFFNELKSGNSSARIIDNIEEEDLDNSRDTIKNDDTAKDSLYAADDDESDVSKKIYDVSKIDVVEKVTSVAFTSDVADSGTEMDVFMPNNFSVDDKVISSHLRGTYFVKETTQKESIDVKSNLTRGTYFVKDTENKINTDVKKGEVLETKNEIKINADKCETKDIFDYSVTSEIKTSTDLLEKEVLVENYKPETIVSKIIKKTAKTSQSSDCSLRQFEQLELAAIDSKETPKIFVEFADVKMLKEKRTYFNDSQKVKNKMETENNIDIISEIKNANKKPPKTDNDKDKSTKSKSHITYFDNIYVNNDAASNKLVDDIIASSVKSDERSPSIVKELVEEPFEPSTIKKLLGESFTKQPDVLSSIHKKIMPKKNDSLDLFESPHIAIVKEIDNVESARKSIEKLVLEQKSTTKTKLSEIKREIKLEPASSTEEPIADDNIDKPETSQNESQFKDNNNTADEFENIYKDITAPRATEFELLVTQEIEAFDTKSDATDETQEVKYNLRNKKQPDIKTFDTQKEIEAEEILAESHAKCENKKPKRNLRLRRTRKNADDEKSDHDEKLKDIVNLQNEFSDVTLDVPAPLKETKDIPSPENKANEVENMPPVLGIQSCPSKSVVRSRRKLFTPRAEPLEESLQAGDSSERIYVPRPSYHRARARRKL